MTNTARRPGTSSAPTAARIALAGLVSLLAWGCSTFHYARQAGNDLDGHRFFCQTDHSFCLSVLKPSCSLTLDQGESIPPEAEDRIVLRAPGVRRIVEEPEDLVGCISINSPQDAIEYLRFFSSWTTVHLFQDQMLEVYEGERAAYEYGPEGTCYICLPPRRWRTLGLSSPKVVVEAGGYLVTRFVVRPSPDDSNVSDLYRITQRVRHDGSVSLVDEERLPGLTEAERYGLAFPRYL